MTIEDLPLEVLGMVINHLSPEEMKQVQGASRILYSAVVAQRWRTVIVDFNYKKTKLIPSYFERHEGEDLLSSDHRAHNGITGRGIKFRITKAADFVKFCKALHAKELEPMLQHTRDLIISIPMFTDDKIDNVDGKGSPRGLNQKGLMVWFIKQIASKFSGLARININAMYWPDFGKDNYSLLNELMGSLPGHITQNVIINTADIHVGSVNDIRDTSIPGPAFSKDQNLRFLRIVLHHDASWGYRQYGDSGEAFDYLTSKGSLPEALERLEIVSPEMHVMDIDRSYSGFEGQLTDIISRLTKLRTLTVERVLLRPKGLWSPPETVTYLALTDITEVSGPCPKVTSLRCYREVKDDNAAIKSLSAVFPNLRSLYLDVVEKDGLKVLQAVPQTLKTLRVMYARGVHWKIIEAGVHIPNIAIDNPVGVAKAPKFEGIGRPYESLTLSMKRIEPKNEALIEQLSQITSRLYLNSQNITSESLEKRLVPTASRLSCNLVDTMCERVGQNYWTKSLPRDFYRLH